MVSAWYLPQDRLLRIRLPSTAGPLIGPLTLPFTMPVPPTYPPNSLKSLLFMSRDRDNLPSTKSPEAETVEAGVSIPRDSNLVTLPSYEILAFTLEISPFPPGMGEGGIGPGFKILIGADCIKDPIFWFRVLLIVGKDDFP